MKLLFILSEYLPESGGGIISYYAEILPHLVHAGHSVDVLVASIKHINRASVLIDGVQVSYLKSEFIEKSKIDFEHYSVGFSTFHAFLPIAWAAYEQSNHGSEYDLVETTDFPLLFAPWVVSRDSPPVVISLHGSCGQLEWFEYPKQGGLDSDLVRLVERVAFQFSAGLYTNSKANAQFWEQTALRSVRVLMPVQREKKPRRLNIKSAASGLVVGRCQSWKGPRVLCEALKHIPEITIRWIGADVVDRQSGGLQSEILRNNYPEIVGSSLIFEEKITHDLIMDEIANASFLCVPSLWDVFNLTIVEAMSLGTPVICSKRAGASMLIHHRQNGFLFDPDSPEQLAEGIRWVVALGDDERKLLTERARETIQECMNADRLISERVAYYRELMAMTEGRKVDVWLERMLAPRKSQKLRSQALSSYTVLELIEGVLNQLRNGIKRKFYK